MATPLKRSVVEAQKHVIIQCPSCQTKFAVDSAAIGEVASPRFHCSRCDHVFSRALDEIAHPISARGAENDEEAYEDDYEDLPEAEDLDAPETVYEPEEVEPEVADMWEEEQEADSNDARGLEVPRAWDRDLAPTAPHEVSESNAAVETNAPFAVFDMRTGEQVSLDLQPRAERAMPVTVDAPMEDYSKYAIDHADDRSTMDIPAVQVRTHMEQPAPSILPRPSSPWRASAMLGAPVLLCLFVLSVITYVAHADAQMGSSLIAWLYPSSSVAAPAGLHIENAELKKIVLDNGETINVFSGQIKNDSTESLKEIRVEGLLFDAQGNALVTQRASANSGLNKTRIRSLTLEMIRSFQNSKSTKRFELKPGENQEFAIAIFGPELAKARYFSARIFSVR